MQSQLFIRFYEIKKKKIKKNDIYDNNIPRIIRIVHTYKLFMSLARTGEIFSQRFEIFAASSRPLSINRYSSVEQRGEDAGICDYGESSNDATRSTRVRAIGFNKGRRTFDSIIR